MTELYDAIIVGSGAGGAAAAFRLAEAGRRILVLEKGPELPTDGSTQDIRIVVGEGRFHNQDPWLDGRGREFVPQEYYNLGGKTKWCGAALLRFAPEECAANPASQYRGWPFDYAELEPYYDQAETLLRVRSFEIEPDTARLVAALKHVAPAWRAEPMPLGLSSRILEDPREARRFDGFASVHGFKSDAEVCLLDRVRDKPNVTINAGRPIRTLLGDDNAPHRVTGVVAEDGVTLNARSVLLAARALSSPQLLANYLATSGLADKLP